MLALVLLLGLGGQSPEQTPVSVVVLDPGHDLRANLQTEPVGPGSSRRKIKDGGGARGVVTGAPEAVRTLQIATQLAPLLRRAGVRVRFTRTRTVGRSLGNVARATIANRAHAVLFLRIHADGSADPSQRGTATLHPARRRGWTDDIYAPSRRAALLVQAELVRGLRSPDRGLQERGDLTGFNWSNVPAILVEVGFLTNASEDRLLATASYRRRAAEGLCRGTLRFLRRSPQACRRR